MGTNARHLHRPDASMVRLARPWSTCLVRVHMPELPAQPNLHMSVQPSRVPGRRGHGTLRSGPCHQTLASGTTQTHNSMRIGCQPTQRPQPTQAKLQPASSDRACLACRCQSITRITAVPQQEQPIHMGSRRRLRRAHPSGTGQTVALQKHCGSVLAARRPDDTHSIVITHAAGSTGGHGCSTP